MARMKDSEIEARLSRVVKDAIRKGEDITLRIVRSRVEAELGLEKDYLKSDDKWKNRTKSIVQAAVQEAEEPAKSASPVAVKSSTPAKPSQSIGAGRKEIKGDPTRQPKNKAVSTPSQKPVASSDAPPQSHAVNSAALAPSAEADSSSEEEDDDDSQSSVKPQTPPVPKRPIEKAPQVNGVKRKADDHTDSETTSSGSGSEESAVDDGNKHKDKKAKTDVSSSSEESSADGDESSEDEEDESQEKEIIPGSQSSPTKKDSSRTTVPAIPARPFEPPAGFVALGSGSLASNAAFSASSLQGKHIWHITAPSNLPLSSVTELALNAVQSNNPDITHNGSRYVLNEDQAEGNDVSTLLISGPDGYRRIQQPVSRALTIQQKIVLPNLTMRQASQVTGSSAASNIAQPAVSNVSAQPKGLRMRYKPPGFGSGQPGRIGSGSDSADEGEQPAQSKSFQFPRALGGHATSTEPSTSGRREQDLAKTLDKPKKKRKAKQNDEVSQRLVNGQVTSQVVEDSTAPVKKADQIIASGLSNGVATNNLSKEEKARRKEERRLKRDRKEAKEKAQI